MASRRSVNIQWISINLLAFVSALLNGASVVNASKITVPLQQNESLFCICRLYWNVMQGNFLKLASIPSIAFTDFMLRRVKIVKDRKERIFYEWNWKFWTELLRKNFKVLFKKNSKFKILNINIIFITFITFIIYTNKGLLLL